MSSRRKAFARRQIPIINAFPPIPPVPGVVAPGVISGGTVVWPDLMPGPPYFPGSYIPPNPAGYPIIYDGPIIVPPLIVTGMRERRDHGAPQPRFFPPPVPPFLLPPLYPIPPVFYPPVPPPLLYPSVPFIW